MKIVLLAAVILLTGCAANRVSKPDGTGARTSSTGRDVSECERQAALASAGSKAQAFDNCMRARNQTPKQQ
jgi:hypothetical protein